MKTMTSLFSKSGLKLFRFCEISTALPLASVYNSRWASRRRHIHILLRNRDIIRTQDLYSGWWSQKEGESLWCLVRIA